MTNAVTIIPQSSDFQTLVKKAEAKLAELVASGEAEALKVYDEVKPIVVAEAADFLEAVGEIALGAVLKQVPLMLTGGEKFGQAVTATVYAVEGQGKTIAIADAQSAVTKAFTALGVAKANLAPTPSAAAA